MQVNFRYSDTDLIAYLMTIGYSYSKIEITNKDNRVKAYAHFIGEKEDLLRIQEVYKSGESKINIYEFSNHRKMITKAFKEEISKINNTPIRL